jgi:hypothetical protein
MVPLVGITTSFVFFSLQSVGLASGTTSTPAWSDAYDLSSGALVLAGYDSLGGFGKFCGVIVLGLGSNMTASNYSAALDFQVLGRAWRAVPRSMSGPQSQQSSTSSAPLPAVITCFSLSRTFSPSWDNGLPFSLPSSSRSTLYFADMSASIGVRGRTRRGYRTGLRR